MQGPSYEAAKVVILVALLALEGCSTGPVRAPVGRDADAPGSASGRHTVLKGETLYAIAWRHGLDYRQLAAWNAIDPPYIIYPGQRLRLKAGGARHRQAPRSDPKTRTAAGSARAHSGKTNARRSTPWSKKKAPMPVNGWRWPTRGTLITSFAESGRKGIDIAGRLGQSVHAAAEGRVVYSGGGLRGYGKLIIIKHNQRFLSAYAHNNNILVKEGESVASGQHIAEMGRTEAERTMLHFQIRRDGKPVDPVRYLPR